MKILKFIFSFVLIIVVVCLCTVPSFARSIANESTDGRFGLGYTNYGSNVIMSNNDMNITFYGINSSSVVNSTAFVSRYIDNGHFGLLESNKNYLTVYGNSLSDRYESKNQYFNYNNTLVDAGSLVGRPIYGNYIPNGLIPKPLGDTGFYWNNFRYIDSCYYYSDYSPNGLSLNCDELYYHKVFGNWGQDYPGYGGLLLSYLNNSAYGLEIPYYFSCDVMAPTGETSHLDYSGSLYRLPSGSDYSYYIPLIPMTICEEIEYLYLSDYPLDVCRVTNISMSVRLSESVNIPNNSDSPSFTYSPIYEIFAADFGSYQSFLDGEISNTTVIFNNYYALSSQFIELFAANGSLGYDEGYSDGYDQGLSVGYYDGYDDGYEEGQLNPTQSIRDQLYDQGFRDGFSAGQASSSGVDFTGWLGTAVGGFMDFTVFGEVTIGGILYTCIAIALVLAFLKIFAGG